MQRLIALAAVLVLIASAAPAQIQLAAHLTGADVVPPTTSQATGEAQLTLNPATKRLTFRVVTTCVAPAPSFNLTLQLGPPGVNGPVIQTLVSLFGGYGYISPDFYEGQSAPLTDQQIGDLLSGLTYLSININYFFGSIPNQPVMRGQVEASVRRRFTASLDGNGVSPPTGSAGTAAARVTLNQPERTLAYEIDLAGIEASSAELRVGGVAVATVTGGPIRFCGITEALSPAEVAAVRAGQAEVVLTTAAFPGGEIGAPLVEDPGYRFTAKLSGAGMVPPVATAATGFADVTLHTATGVIDYTVTTAGIAGTDCQINAGFFHQPPVLTGHYPGGPSSWTGSTPPMPPIFVELLLRQGLHVTIASAAFPAGEIRGQLVPNPGHFGFGSFTGVAIARADHRGEPLLGSPDWTATLSGAPADTQLYLFIGFANQIFAGQTLPVDLQSGGAGRNRSFLWFDPTPGVFVLPQVSDPWGCAAITIPIPDAPVLQGLETYYQWLIASGGTPAGFSVSECLRVVAQ